MLFANLFNIDYRSFNYDYSHGFKVLPDYITGTHQITYRKERKQFILY